MFICMHAYRALCIFSLVVVFSAAFLIWSAAIMPSIPDAANATAPI